MTWIVYCQKGFQFLTWKLNKLKHLRWFTEESLWAEGVLLGTSSTVVTDASPCGKEKSGAAEPVTSWKGLGTLQFLVRRLAGHLLCFPLTCSASLLDCLCTAVAGILIGASRCTEVIALLCKQFLRVPHLCINAQITPRS